MKKKISAAQIFKTREQVIKSLKRLEGTYNKLKTSTADPEVLSDDELEVWESLLARFARAVDLFSAKYLRGMVLAEEPGFRGSTLDLLNAAEKLGFIASAKKWFELKELRNKQAHEYEDEDLEGLFIAVRAEVPYILKIKKKLELL